MWKFKFLCSENISLTISSLFGRGRKCLICSALLAVALVAPVAHAQETNDDENELEEIVVTATRIPTPLADTLPTTAIITAEDIERIKPQDFGELLKLTSGIGFRDSGGRGSSGALYVRGASPKHTLVLINGMRISGATRGLTAIENIPLESIERIEIIKGPMSGVYGSDAIGGVIQIFTKQKFEGESFATVNSTFGSNNLQKYSGRAGYGNSAYSVSASLSTESTDGIDRTNIKDKGNEDKDGFEQSSGDFSLTAILQDSAILKFNHLKSLVRVEYDRCAELNNCYKRARLETTSLKLEYDHSDALNIVGTVGVAKDFATNFEDEKLSYHNTRKADYSFQGNLIIDPQNQVSIGVDYQKDRVSSTSNYKKNERTNKGFFALWQYQGDQTSTVLNARHDKDSFYGSLSNYSMQQSFDVTDQYRFVASYGTAFKAPTFNELRGYAGIEPEESKSFEISLRASLDEINWQINAYQTKVKNLIRWALTDTGFQPSNIDNSTLRGVEFELNREWDDYIIRASLDYLDAKDDKSGKFLSDRARASGSVELGKQTDNLYVGVDTFIEHSRFDSTGFSDSLKLHRLPGYALWGVTANYQFSDTLSISGRIDNLFDKEYVTNLINEQHSYQNEGRTIEISLEYRF